MGVKRHCVPGLWADLLSKEHLDPSSICPGRALTSDSQVVLYRPPLFHQKDVSHFPSPIKAWTQQQPRFGTEPYSMLLAKDQAWKQPPVRQVPRAGAAHRDVINSAERIRAGTEPCTGAPGACTPWARWHKAHMCPASPRAPGSEELRRHCLPCTHGLPGPAFFLHGTGVTCTPTSHSALAKTKGKKKKGGVSQGKKQLCILSLGCLNEWINYTLSFHNYAYTKLHNERSLP